MIDNPYRKQLHDKTEELIKLKSKDGACTVF